MNVLALIDTLPVSGPAKGLLQLLDRADELGVRYAVSNFEYPGRASGFNARMRSRPEPFLAVSQSGHWDWRFLRALRAFAQGQGVQLVQSHSFKPHLAARWLARELGVPWLAFAHGWTAEDRKVRFYNAMERRLLRLPTHVVAVSDGIRRTLLAGGRCGPVSVVANAAEAVGVDARADVRDAARAQLRLGEDDCVVAVIGRLSWEKGQDLLLAALERLSPAARPWVLFAGDGPERPRLEALTRADGLDRVRFLGHLSDPSPVFDAANALVVPSRSEGVPNVALEALAHGLPILATNVGSLADIVIDGETGWLVPEARADLIADALAQLVAAHAEHSADALAAMGQAGRDRVLPRFGIERRVAAMRGIYGELGARPPEREPRRGREATA